MSKFFAEQDIKPLKLSASTDQLYEIQNYINETIGAYINHHKKALVYLYGEKDRLTTENTNLRRAMEQMAKEIDILKKEIKGKADAPLMLR